MSDTVVIKGTKSGIILVLDKNVPYGQIKKDIAKKFHDSSDFLGTAKKAISFQGMELDDGQKLEIIDLIHENCNLSIVCIMDDNPDIEESFKKTIERSLAAQADSSTGQFFKGNLRSGQVLDVETSIIIIGDVKAGAKVISKGNVIILGSLKGTVYAGSSGNHNAFVVALDMQPVQIRIADTIARSPDKPDKKKIKQGTKIAFWEDGNIYIELLDKDVIPDIRL